MVPAEVELGVPEMTQVVLMLRPAGREGEEEQAVGAPPVLIGVIVVVVPRFKVTVEGL